MCSNMSVRVLRCCAQRRLSGASTWQYGSVLPLDGCRTAIHCRTAMCLHRTGVPAGSAGHRSATAAPVPAQQPIVGSVYNPAQLRWILLTRQAEDARLTRCPNTRIPNQTLRCVQPQCSHGTCQANQLQRFPACISDASPEPFTNGRPSTCGTVEHLAAQHLQQGCAATTFNFPFHKISLKFNPYFTRSAAQLQALK